MDIFLLFAPSSLDDRDDENVVHRMLNSSEDSSKRLMPGSPPRQCHNLRCTKRFRGSQAKRRIDQVVPHRANNQLDDLKARKDSFSAKPQSSGVATRTTSQRLAEAERRRRNLHDGRVEALRDRSVARLTAAQRRAERLKLMRVAKAHIESDIRVAEVRERRARMLEAERVAIVTASEARERGAARRAEETSQSRVNRNRSDLEKRIIRVRDRRALLECERRAALLASLDYRSRRASRNLRRSLDGRRERASFEVRHAAEVSTRVKAVRAIQRAARGSFDLPSSFSSLGPRLVPEISQNEAATRLQRWRLWRSLVCVRRFLSVQSNAKENKSPASSLETILSMVEPAKNRREPVPFESVRLIMTQSTTLRAAQTFLYCMRPLIQDQDHANDLNDRSLLSAFLISSHPDEVLGDNQERDKRAEVLYKSSEKLVNSIHCLYKELQQRDDARTKDVAAAVLDAAQDVCTSLTRYTVLFHLWKNADLESLVDRILSSATQSWLAYLASNELLQYIDEQALGGSLSSFHERIVDKQVTHSANSDDPLLSVRLRHEAQLSGAKSHIKRIRVSLNKIVGIQEGRRLVRVARDTASSQLSAQGTVAALKEEVDDLLGNNSSSVTDNDGNLNSTGKVPVSYPSVETNDSKMESFQSSEASIGVNLPGNVDVPGEILSNEKLVHAILLTEPTNFDKLTWDGKPLSDGKTVEDFMSSWESRKEIGLLLPARQSEEVFDFQRCVANTMKMAFFDHITQTLAGGDFGPTSKLLQDMHNAIRQLIPTRKDLHSYLSDEDAEGVHSVVDVLSVLQRAACALAKHLEAPARAVSTREWASSAEVYSASKTGEAQTKSIPFQLRSEETFVAASIAFLLHKVEQTKVDIANFKLRQVAPIIHHIGQKYQMDKLQERYGPIALSSIASITEKLPSTSAWVGSIARCLDSSGEFGSISSYEKRMSIIKTRGFVDGLLFTNRSLALPEVLEMDSMRIAQIRSEASYSVIGSALVLHACNVSRVGASVLKHVPLSGEVIARKDTIAKTLRAKYTTEDDMMCSTSDAVKAFAEALSGKIIDSKGMDALRSCVAAVVSGNDPVLKLLDNRTKQFFRFACRWEEPAGDQRHGTQEPSYSPVPMRTGRLIVKHGETSGESRSGKHSSARAFSVASGKEASRLGFALFAEELVEASDAARSIINLCCKQYGGNILDQLLVNAIQDGDG